MTVKDSLNTREMLRLTLLNYILCFVLLTLTEVVFSGLYFLMRGKIDLYILLGIALYVLGLITTYSGYKEIRYKIKSQEMLEAFLGMR